MLTILTNCLTSNFDLITLLHLITFDAEGRATPHENFMLIGNITPLLFIIWLKFKIPKTGVNIKTEWKFNMFRNLQSIYGHFKER